MTRIELNYSHIMIVQLWAGVVPIVLQSIAILLKFCNIFCNTFEILQYLLQYFRNFAIIIAIL